jgi:4-amino-4-deoxy-L-arabinose transferase-like glycosyltransferase
VILTPYVMPNFYNEQLPLSQRLKSTSVGDSEAYGRYADGFLRQHAFQNPDGQPVILHMPGLPLILAVFIALFGTADAFRAGETLFFFATLYCFLILLKDKVPALVLAATILVMALHPLMAQLFTAIMSDILFTSLLLWIAFVLYRPDPSVWNFLCVGLIFGVAVYLRESALVFVFALGLAYLVKDTRKYLRPVGVMVCVFVLLLSPWVLRNYVRTGRVIPLTTKGTNLIYISSFPLTTEFYWPFTDTYDYANSDKRYATLEPGSSPIREAARNYVSQPREQLNSTALKTIALLNKPSVLQRPLSHTATIALHAFNAMYYVFHIGVILVGVALVFSKRGRAFPYLPYLMAAQYAQALLLWSETRYLVPFYPFLIVLAFSWYMDRYRARLAGGPRMACEPPAELWRRLRWLGARGTGS